MRLIDAEPIEKYIENGLNCKDLQKRFGHDAVEILTEVHYAPTIAPPPNDPLTLEELREMDGEPVWCEKFEWRICYGVTDFRGYPCMETGGGCCIHLNDYGKTWQAYRRKPEEGTI